jgi:carbonic anhydrase/acetyltransferase-like protein (isoleucine patch superfamily)
VEIGHNTNLQDGVSVGSMNPSSSSTKVGSSVSVGHGAVLQGCTVEDNVLIGMNAVLQDGVKVRGKGAFCSGSESCLGAAFIVGKQQCTQGMNAVLQDGVKVGSRRATCSEAGKLCRSCVHCWQAAVAATAGVTARSAVSSQVLKSNHSSQAVCGNGSRCWRMLLRAAEAACVCSSQRGCS